ncbi:MAG: septum formation family protein [Pontimonas sp.]
MTAHPPLLHSRWFWLTVVGALPALAVGYWLGSSLAGQDSNSAEATGTNAPIPAASSEAPAGEVAAQAVVDFPAVGSGSRPAGLWSWEELRGGECVKRFDGPFAAEFEVVDCAQPHAAEFHRAQLLSDDPGVDYPGDQFVRDQASGLCKEWDLADLREPQRFDDLVVVPGYSIGQTQWEKGQRVAGCFIYRESGDTLDPQLGR